MRSSACIQIALFAILAFAICGCRQAPTTIEIPVAEMLNGRTMGTTYTVKYMPSDDAPSKEEVAEAIASELALVNAQMSTYIASSELSKFNNSPSTDWVEVSADLVQVIELARKVSTATNGTFDVTVGPLVDLWGFGPSRSRESVPTDEAIVQTLQRCGIRHLESRASPPALKKALSSLRVDLNAIAKGHGVDRVAAKLGDLGIQSFFVEIGGEIRAGGTKGMNSPWRAGIEKPVENGRELLTPVDLHDEALATSGNYRNFYQADGAKYWHTLDPRTGRPGQSSVLQASVKAETCAEADAIATALMVLGEDGIALAEKHGWSVMLVVATADEKLDILSTGSFRELAGQFAK